MRVLTVLILSFFTLAIAPVSAADGERWQSYDAKTFKAAQTEGRTILVDVFATWCPTCKKQAPILNTILKDPALKDVMAVKVNWDSDKDFVQQYRIPRQSTILVFVGEKETARSIAETREARLRDVVLNGVKK